MLRDTGHASTGNGIQSFLHLFKNSFFSVIEFVRTLDKNPRPFRKRLRATFLLIPYRQQNE